MRAVVQRVLSAEVTVSGQSVGRIGPGLCVFVGVGGDDDEKDARSLAEKVVGLRIFEDEAGKLNRSLAETGGGLLAISQFTLFGDARRGKRPSFTDAMQPERAEPLFECFCRDCRGLGIAVQTRAEMKVELVNDGPVTILVDTKKLF
jgi:D-tyrosyl-tRNA(Tyr) deacylase